MDRIELDRAFNEAETIISNANQLARRAIMYSAGRLRTIGLDRDTLKLLKIELQQFDALRRRWTK